MALFPAPRLGRRKRKHVHFKWTSGAELQRLFHGVLGLRQPSSSVHEAFALRATAHTAPSISMLTLLH